MAPYGENVARMVLGFAISFAAGVMLFVHIGQKSDREVTHNIIAVCF